MSESKALEFVDGTAVFSTQPEWGPLATSLRRARGFALFFVRINAPIHRRRFAAEVKEYLARPVIDAELDPSSPKLIDFQIEEQLVGAPENAVVLVHDLDALLPSMDEEARFQRMGEINIRRPAFGRLGHPLVFILPEYALKELAHNAPDFYDWYSGVYEFDGPMDENQIIEAGLMSRSLNDDDLFRLSREEKERWIETLKVMVARVDTIDSAGLWDWVRSFQDLCRLYYNLGNFREALNFAFKTNDLIEKFDNNEAKINNFEWIGEIYYALGDYDKAEKFMRDSLEWTEKMFGIKHPRYAARLGGLGTVLNTMGYYPEAERLCRQALVVDEKTIGKDHPDYAIHLSYLVRVLSAQGNYSEAEGLCRQALAITEKAVGKDHPRYASRLYNLAVVLRVRANYAEAEGLYRQALAIEKKTIGEDHPRYAVRLNNLAGALEDQGNYAEAEGLYRQALAITEKTIGEDHPRYAIRLNNLAVVLKKQGKWDEARGFYEQALAISQRTLPPDHPQIKTIQANFDRLKAQMEPSSPAKDDPGSKGDSA